MVTATAADGTKNALSFVRSLQAGQLNGIKPADCGPFADILTEAARAFELNGTEAALKVIASNPALLALAAGEVEPTTPPTLADTGQWLSAKTVLDAHYRGETGDAELLAQLFNRRLKYDHAEKTWYLWAGHYWQADTTRQVKRLVSNQVAAQYLHTAAELQKTAGDDEVIQDTVKELQKRAGSLRFKSKIGNVLDLAQSQPAMALTGDEWEPNPLKLAVQNGVIDLTTGSFEPGHPADLIRTAAPGNWQGLTTPAPQWERFLQDIFTGDGQLISFVQRLFGYAIIGQVTEHILPILWGQGRNGKGTLLETIKAVLGDLAGPVSKDVLISSNRDRAAGAATPHLAALRPLRIAWVSETKDGSELDVDQVKLITGGDTITARKLHSDPVTFRPKHTVFLLTNPKPKANPDDYALWQRLLLIPFTESYIAKPTADNEHLADTALPKKLKAEAAGILAWLVRGALDWQQNGLNPPQSVRLATETYQQEQDDISQFITECCIVESGREARAGDLYQTYEKWADSYGSKANNKTVFGRKLGKRFEKRLSAGVVYSGIGLLQ